MLARLASGGFFLKKNPVHSYLFLSGIGPKGKKNFFMKVVQGPMQTLPETKCMMIISLLNYGPEFDKPFSRYKRCMISTEWMTDFLVIVFPIVSFV